MERRMKRDANVHDLCISIYSTLPRITHRTLREKAKGAFAISEIRIGKVLLFFAGSDIAAFARMSPVERNNEKSELIYEQFAKDSMRGTETAAFLEKNEVVFNGEKFKGVKSGKEFHANLHRVLATESTEFITSRVERILQNA